MSETISIQSDDVHAADEVKPTFTPLKIGTDGSRTPYTPLNFEQLHSDLLAGKAVVVMNDVDLRDIYARHAEEDDPTAGYDNGQGEYVCLLQAAVDTDPDISNLWLDTWGGADTGLCLGETEKGEPELRADGDEAENEVRDWNKAVAAHNVRLAELDKQGKLSVDELFDENYLRDAVREALATYLETQLQRNCRAADGSIDFVSGDHDDGCWDNQSLIIDALLPIVIEMYDSQYGDEGRAVRGGIKWLGMKAALILSEMDAGDYCGASAYLAEGTCLPAWHD